MDSGYSEVRAPTSTASAPSLERRVSAQEAFEVNWEDMPVTPKSQMQPARRYLMSEMPEAVLAHPDSGASSSRKSADGSVHKSAEQRPRASTKTQATDLVSLVTRPRASTKTQAMDLVSAVTRPAEERTGPRGERASDEGGLAS